jgi:molybdopterin-guanine dinucleotide biosynthesis protein A
MGRDKAWLEIEGAPMIERVIRAARPTVARLGIIVNAANPQIERYERLAESHDARLIFDLHEHRGPLGGVHTALAQCGASESALILACDLPFITTEFLSLLCEIHQSTNPQPALRNSRSITVPVDQSNRLQPLAAIYDQSLESMVRQMLAENDLKVDLLYSRVSTRQVGFDEFAHLPDAQRLFTNINTLEEFEALRPN